MIYLDYAANTPVNEQVLDIFCDVTKKYIANANSSHRLGGEAKALLDNSTLKIKELLDVRDFEVIFTSGATESNNLAIKGVAEKYKKYGKHIITTYLEHSSVNGAIAALQMQGFEVDYVGIDKNGLVNLEELKELMRKDTILVSICYVDSEIGICQQIDKIGEIISNYPNCIFHTDATQAVGKIPIIPNAHLISFAPHKFYGLNGCGVLLKKESLMLEPQIHGGISTTPYRSGTPPIALIAATAKALELAMADIKNKYEYVNGLNNKLRAFFEKNPKIRINSTSNSVPFILNISISGVKTAQILSELEKREIYLSSKSACCAPNTISRPVYALTKDKKAALSTIRISLSHLTTREEIDAFIANFEDCCKDFI